MTRILICLALAASPALACDWSVTRTIDPMTDAPHCLIHSPSAHLGIGVHGRAVTFVSGSPYYRDFLTVRVDDRPAIALTRDNASTSAFQGYARDLLTQILTGSRIRVQFRDEDGEVNGDAPICDLPQIIRSCMTP